MKRLLLPLALALLFSLSACAKSAPEPTPTPAPTPEDTPPVEVQATPTPNPVPTADPLWGEQVFTREFSAGDGTVVLAVSYRLPMVLNTDAYPAGEAINRWYQAEGAARMGEAEEAHEMAVSDYDVSAASGLPFQATQQDMSYEITWQDSQLVSIKREWYINSGGPYPNMFRLSEQFDALTGAKLGFADLFSDVEPVLARVVDAFLLEDTISQAISQGVLTKEAVSVSFQPENFYLTDQGFTFWIQGGTWPGIHAPIEVTLPYEALEDLRIDG